MPGVLEYFHLSFRQLGGALPQICSSPGAYLINRMKAPHDITWPEGSESSYFHTFQSPSKKSPQNRSCENFCQRPVASSSAYCCLAFVCLLIVTKHATLPSKSGNRESHQVPQEGTKALWFLVDAHSGESFLLGTTLNASSFLQPRPINEPSLTPAYKHHQMQPSIKDRTQQMPLGRSNELGAGWSATKTAIKQN